MIFCLLIVSRKLGQEEIAYMKTIGRRCGCLLLVVTLLLGMIPAVFAAPTPGMDNFKRERTYTAGTFSDVPEGRWYTEAIQTAYEYGLASGDNGQFDRKSNMSVAMAVTLAARLHAIYHTGSTACLKQGSPWYQVYVDYALDNGIIEEGQFANYHKTNATRAECAAMLSKAIPASELPAINTVEDGAIPDVAKTSPYYDDIYRLYRAGILTGNDAKGTFTPDEPIDRVSMITIATRMVDKSLRQSVTLKAEKGDSKRPDPTVGMTSDAIQPLSVAYDQKVLDAIGSVEPYGEHWVLNTTISEDISQAPGLAYSLVFSDSTRFPNEGKLPAGYDPDALLEWGKNPGLDVDLLHEYGFTGKGAVIAYVDQPIGKHELYEKMDLHYVNNSGKNEEMHGPAVLSLLAGKGIGTAPEAEIYFYAHAAWKADQTTHAECLYQIIEQNQSLPEGEKITMVGFSDGIDEREKNAQAFRDAVAACEKAGIMVWFCQEYGAAHYLPFSDKNNPENLTQTRWWSKNSAPGLVFVPDSGRTTATTGDAKYIYWTEGGLSWTMPYVLGLYAIVNEIDPTLTQDELREMIVDTAYVNSADMRIINPVGFVAAALKGVGRTAEAEELLLEQAARRKYMYAIMDTAALSKEDLTAIGEYLSNITEATVLVADASSFSNAQDLYTALKADAAARGGTVTGVQIFGTPDMVPAFQIKYRVQMASEVDDGGTILTDLFYGNFDNDPKLIGENYSVLDHFAEGWNVDLVPDWPVARLPLSKGEFKAFFEKYEDFALETALKQPDLVNFSNPIFKQTQHSDDMGTFLNRMKNEFKLLDVPYRLYGNLDGDVPVNAKVLGGFTKENVAKENDKGVMELLINTHGQWNNIDQCIFVNGKEQRISFLNMNDINTVLDGNAYYLDTWTCLNGSNMANNLTTTALTGQCVGMFSATTIISNNGVDCRASVEQMKQSNFYYFYYSYLKALHEGQSRSQAFCSAQQAYGKALIADSANGIRRGEGNYQFNLYNLLAYHNFGVLEPNAAAMALLDGKGYIAQAGQSVPKQPTTPQGGGNSPASTAPVLTNGKPVGSSKSVSHSVGLAQLKTGTPVIHGVTSQGLDNGYTRFTVECTVSKGMQVCVFSPPDGDIFKLFPGNTTGDKQTVVFDLSKEDLAAMPSFTISFNFSGDDRFFLFIKT